VLTFGLMAVAALAALSGYTNILTAANLRAAAGARADAENGVNEAVYRLSLPYNDASVILPVQTNPNWTLDILYTTGDNDPTDGEISTIQNPADWPEDHDIDVPVATLDFKRDDTGKVIFYNRAVTPGNPPFMSVNLPGTLGTVVGSVYELLCAMPSILGIQVGGVLGLCPVNVPQMGYPVVRIRATGLDARGAQRELVAEAARSIAFTPFGPLNSGGAIDLNGTGFIDGVNHDARIHLTASGGAGGIYGDDNNETTNNSGLLGLPLLGILDSPDDIALYVPGFLELPLTVAVSHAVGNATLALYFASNYQSFPRLYNLQIANGDNTPAWVGLSQLTSALTAPVNLPGGGLALVGNLGAWTGINYGYSAPIVLTATGTVANPPAPPLGNMAVWTQGVFSWGTNNHAAGANYPGTQPVTAPAVNTVVECGPTVVGQAPPMVCRPARMATIPTMEDYLGINEISFASLIANPDTTQAQLDLGQAPLGFTYVGGHYTLGAATASPDTNQYGLMYVKGNLTVNGFHTFKGLIYVDGSVTISAGAHLAVLGAVVARTGYTHVGTGRTTLLYSRDAALQGVSHARPWRILAWVDAAALQ
jgi:hypothetical protein